MDEARPRGMREAWREVLLPVAMAALVSFVVDLAFVPSTEATSLAGRFAGFAVSALFAFLLGSFLGKRTWPRRGRRLALRLLRRETRARTRPLLYLSGRPDQPSSTLQRVLEATGFAAGANVLLVTVLALLGVPLAGVAGVLFGVFLLTTWGGFVLVPYWAFARAGLRRADPVRWIVEPLSARYAGRLRLNNGALLLLPAASSTTLALRAGASGDEALLGTLRLLAPIVASVLVVTAAAVAYYNRQERVVLAELERAALALGVHDARRLTDNEILPVLASRAAQDGAGSAAPGQAQR